MSLIKSSVVVGGLTMVSRVLGFIRDIFLAQFLGAGLAADAFFVAFKLPNLFRRLFAEGAFSAAFVPLFSQAAARGEKEGQRFAENILAVLLPVVLLFTAIVEVFMPWVVLAITGGFYDAPPEKFALAVELTRITFPFLALISLTSLLAGVLNGSGRFSAAAAAPVLLNICMITALLFYHEGEAEAAKGLAVAVTFSGLLQCLWLSKCAAKAGIPLFLRLPEMSAPVRQMLLIMAPAALGAGAQQLNLLIDTILASRFLPQGSISYLYFGDRLNQLPVGVIGVAVGTVLLPTLARQIAKGEDITALHSQNRAIEFALLLTLPAAIGLVCVGDDILRVLFERGAFDQQASMKSAAALAAYALGLPAYVLIKVLTPGFFARKDTRTPVKIATISILTNSALGILLLIPFAHVGLALATAVSAWLNAGLLYLVLKKRGHFSVDAALRKNTIRMVFAGAVMVPVILMLSHWMESPLHSHTGIGIAALILMIFLGIATYISGTIFLGALKIRDMKRLVKRT